MSTRKGQVAKVSTQTYPVPSFWNPVAFVTRATLPPSFDLVFGKNARYPVQLAEIGKNPFQVRRNVLKRATSLLNFQAVSQPQAPSLKDARANSVLADSSNPLLKYLKEDTLHRTLSGLDPMTPTLSNQKFWAQELSPESWAAVNLWTASEDAPELGSAQPSRPNKANQVWNLLVHYNTPLLSELATSAQLSGIVQLGLNQKTPPSVSELSLRLKEFCGWTLVEASGEVPPREFFKYLAQRRFPVVPGIRPMHALFCGYEPDFWHESIGHLSFLTDPKWSEFYQFCGQIVEDLSSHPHSEKTLNSLYQLLWTLMEYGIFKTPQGRLQAFGAALTSSFMALQRLKRGYITTREFDPQAVLKSGFATEGPIRRRGGRIVFYHVSSLEQAKHRLIQWLATTSGFSLRPDFTDNMPQATESK